MSLQATIRRATELAYDEDADQIVGKIDGEWAIAHNEDVARIANMDAKTTFRVRSYGIDAADFMEAMERMGIEGDQDWQAETTTYEIDDEYAVVDGTCIRFVPKIMIHVINPFSGIWVERDITSLPERELDAYAQLMDDDLREELHSEGYSTPAEFLAAWVKRVGPHEAGRVILGS